MPVDGRAEFSYLDYENQYATYESVHKFQFSDFYFQIKGMLTHNIGFNFKTGFNSNNINANSILDRIQYANLTYKSDNSRWFFSAGRFMMKVGTVEQSYNPADVYAYSVIENNLAVYKTGITIQYSSVGLQRFGFQMMNADNEDEVQDLEYNLYWYGHIIKDKVKTYMSVTSKDRTEDEDLPYSINLGLRWNFGSLHLDTDYARVKNMVNFYPDADYTSIPIKIGYAWKYFSPYIKYIYNQVDFEGEGYEIPMENGTTEMIYDASIHTLELALQYYPFEDKNIRFYLTGDYSTDGDISIITPGASMSSTRQHYNAKLQVLAGIRIGFDLVKGWK
ncbi:porin [Prolixibacteraceae bacterium]|nr:porin [Prolixibacteraceae bacterium]